MRKKLFILLLLVILIQIPLFSATTGKLAGKVKDENGTPVPYATVVLVVQGTQVGAETNEKGTYTIINIPPGTYEVSCQRGGFIPAKKTGVVINMDLTKILNFTIKATKVKIDDFDVTEDREEMVQAGKTSSGRQIKADDIEDIAVVSIEGVIALQAGVSLSGGELHFRGGRANEVVYQVDGMSVSDVVDGGSALTLDMDAVEFTDVKTGGFTAEYGNAQSGIINITTKSGGKDYSGKIETISDHVITDNNSSNLDQIKFNIGGPVLTPLVSSLRDKFTFFLNVTGSWDDTRYKNHFANDPVEDLLYLSNSNFSSSDPYSEREDFLGFDLGDRNMNQYNANFKLKYQFNAKQNLTMAIRGDKLKYKSFNYTMKYALEHFLVGESMQNQIAGTYDHTFTPKTNLKIKASYYHKENQVGPNGIPRDAYFSKNPGAFELYADNTAENCTGINYLTYNGLIGEESIYDWTILSDGKEKGIPFTRPGAITGFYADDENSVMTLRSDFEYQLNQIHGFKTGVEITKHYIRKDQWSNPWVIDQTRFDAYLDEYATPEYWAYTIEDSIVFSDVILPEHESDLIKVGYLLDDYYDAIIASAGSTDGYEAFPWQGAYYLQDKMEWEGMIVNAGLRFDFWYLGEEYKILKDAGNYVWEKFGDDERFQTMISPRLGVSHPISETAVMHFAYNYQNQLPQMSYIFTTDRPEDAITSSSQVVVGTPNLEPQVTITYEVGLQKQLSEDYVMDIQAYYKNIYNYASTQKVYSEVDDNVSWYEYISQDYGSARGIDFNLEKRISNFIMGSTSYSLAWASGNNSATVIQDVSTNLREFPLDWDMRHNYSLSVTFKISRGEEFYVPFTDFAFPTYITDDFSTNFFLNVASGKPYTARTQNGTSYDTNSSLQPYTINANLRFTKKVKLTEKMDIKAYILIDNLFDKKNINWVYPVTGSPYYDGADISEPNSTYVADEVAYLHDLATRNPSAIAQGRTFTVGVALRF